MVGHVGQNPQAENVETNFDVNSKYKVLSKHGEF